MQRFKIQVKSKTPYMQHRMDETKLEEWEKQRGLIIERPEINQKDLLRAEYHCYRNKEGRCFIPADQIRGALINAGGMMKSKVGTATKSMKSSIAAFFFMNEDQILISDFDEIDKRSAVNKNIKARIIVIRPKWSNWTAEFTLNIDNDTISKESVEELLKYAGSNIGIGSFRPTNNGMFGQFETTKIERL